MRVNVAAVLVVAALAPLPARADGTDWAGFTCGAHPNVASTNARVSAGPWAAVDLFRDDLSGPGHLSAADVVVHCVLQSTPVPGAPDVHSHGFGALHASGTGVAAGVSEILPLPASGSVYVCTYVEMAHDGWYDSFVADSDDTPANGVTCARVR